MGSRAVAPGWLGVGLVGAMTICCGDSATDDEAMSAAQTATSQGPVTTATSAASGSTSTTMSTSGADTVGSTGTTVGSTIGSLTESDDAGNEFEEFAPVLTILESTCGGVDQACHHYNEFATMKPVLQGAEAYDNLVDVPSSVGIPYVDSTGNLQNSYLWEKLTQDAPTEGERMPLGWPPLDDGSLDTIRAWIEGGALP